MPRKKKTKDGVPGESGVRNTKPRKDATIGDNSKLTDDERRSLFLKHKGKLEGAKREVDSARADLREVKAKLKADGFAVKAVEDAILMETPEGEAKVRDRLAQSIEAARYVGASLGTQFTFDLAGVDKTPSVDRAFDEGKRASMENHAAKPPYDPSTEQYRSYMAGFHEHQSKLASKIKAPATVPADGEKDVRPRFMTERPN